MNTLQALVDLITCVMMICVTAAAMDINDIDEDQFEDVDDE